MYVPMSCAGMLMRLQDAAKHRIRLIVDMKMGAIANNYGVVTLCFAATSPSLVNTTAARLGGKRQQYMARPCTAQPVMQAIISSEGEENLAACFEDLVWLCKQVGSFDLKKQLVQVQADYAPGIAAARRNVFPAACLLGDYFHYKKALKKSLPKQYSTAAAAGARGRNKTDPRVSNLYELSDLTRPG